MRLAQRLIAVFGCAALALALVGCGARTPKEEVEQTSTDQLFGDDVLGAEFYVFQLGPQTLTVENCYDVDVSEGKSLPDGSFYKVVADVTYLNGGVAGYVDYPVVNSVESLEKVSPLDIGLPSIAEETYGLMLIGDYAEGDVLLNELNTMAVWKDGSWLYRYDSTIKLPDGTIAGVRDGVTQAEVEDGIKDGVLSCEDYFALLPNR